MAKLKNTGGPCDIFQPTGHPDSCHVEAGAVVEVPGTATDGGDAWVINGRRWPKSRWDQVAEPKPQEKPKAEDSKADNGKEK